MALPPSGNALKFIINHVILPPLLPQSDDASSLYELELVRFARIQAIAFEAEGPLGSKACWGRIVKMLSIWLEVKEHGFIFKGALMAAMSTLSDGGRFSSQQVPSLKLILFQTALLFISGAKMPPLLSERIFRKLSVNVLRYLQRPRQSWHLKEG